MEMNQWGRGVNYQLNLLKLQSEASWRATCGWTRCAILATISAILPLEHLVTLPCVSKLELCALRTNVFIFLLEQGQITQVVLLSRNGLPRSLTIYHLPSSSDTFENTLIRIVVSVVLLVLLQEEKRCHSVRPQSDESW
jgi:hypothetical protein